MTDNIAIKAITESDLLERETLDGFPHEVINGMWAEDDKMAGWQHGQVAISISSALHVYCKATKMGAAVPDNVHFVMEGSPNCITEARIPDVAFVGNEKLAKIDNPQGVVYFAPDIAIEVVSPSESTKSVLEKMVCYLEGGTLEFWAVYPDRQLVVVHLADGTAFTYAIGDTLTSSLLPNFELPLADIF